MPLDYSKSPTSFNSNVSKEVAAGKPKNQALAIAYSAQGQRKSNKKPRFKKVKDYFQKQGNQYETPIE